MLSPVVLITFTDHYYSQKQPTQCADFLVELLCDTKQKEAWLFLIEYIQLEIDLI